MELLCAFSYFPENLCHNHATFTIHISDAWTKFTPTPGPLHLLCPLPGILPAGMFTWLALLHSAVCSNVTFPERPQSPALANHSIFFLECYLKLLLLCLSSPTGTQLYDSKALSQAFHYPEPSWHRMPSVDFHWIKKSVKLLIVAAGYLPKDFTSVAIAMLSVESTRKHQPMPFNNKDIYYFHVRGKSWDGAASGFCFSGQVWTPLRAQILSVFLL